MHLTDAVSRPDPLNKDSRLKVPVLVTAAAVLALNFAASEVQAQHLNPVIDLLQAKKQVFGLYAPARRAFGRGAPAPGADTTTKTASQIAAMAIANTQTDYIFDGSMEGNFDNAYPLFSEFAKAMAAGEKATKAHRGHPLFVKTPEIAPNPALAAERVSKQLNTGVMGIMMVGVESAEEVRQGIAAMRFKSHGGTRPENVGDAPAVWGLSEKEYKEKADLWPLNPKGDLMNFVVVESVEGLAHVDEIAAVPGIGVLFPGAGTLGGVFTKKGPDGKLIMGANGRPQRDDVAWEAAIQQVLAACKKHNVPCGYPTNESDMEMRQKQGFTVHVAGWGDAGFRAVDVGRKHAGR